MKVSVICFSILLLQSFFFKSFFYSFLKYFFYLRARNYKPLCWLVCQSVRWLVLHISYLTEDGGLLFGYCDLGPHGGHLCVKVHLYTHVHTHTHADREAER